MEQKSDVNGQNQAVDSEKEFAERVCVRLNEIKSRLPLEEAVMDQEYQSLIDSLSKSKWRVICDEYKKVGDKVYGRSRVVSVDSEDYRRVMG